MRAQAVLSQPTELEGRLFQSFARGFQMDHFESAKLWPSKHINDESLRGLNAILRPLKDGLLQFTNRRLNKRTRRARV
jgi:hypothetical protein